jgi:hypothetical protein
LMGFAKGEDEKVVAEGQVMNLEGDTLHCKVIEEGCLSVSITKSHDDAYELFENVD